MNEHDLNTLQSNGVFGDCHSEFPPTSCIPLGVLLSNPFFWKSSKIVAFLRDAWNCIKSEGVDTQVDTFKQELLEISEKALKPETDWTEVLGETDWATLQRDGAKSKTPKRTRHPSNAGKSIVQLLRLIRNKAEHTEGFDDEEKATLGWFPEGTLDDHEFAIYWTNKFPKLLPIIWWKFYEFKDNSKISCYYPRSLDLYKNKLNLNWEAPTVIEAVVGQFYEALECHQEEGGLVKRYISSPTSGEPSVSVELRVIESKSIDTLLEGSSYVKIKVANGAVIFTWGTASDTIAIKDYSITHTPKRTIIPYKNKKLTTLIAANNIKDDYLYNVSCSDRVVFLFSEHAIDNSAAIGFVKQKFESINNISLDENPLNWDEIRIPNHYDLQSGELLLQNKVLKLREILLNGNAYSSVVSTLEGDNLNQLLKKRKLSLFTKNIIPQLPNLYLPRYVSIYTEVSSKILRHRSLDMIVVTNITLEQLRQFTKAGEIIVQVNPDISSLDTNKICGRIILFENRGHRFMNVLEALKCCATKDKSIHHIRYKDKDTFEWLGTYGSLSIVRKSFVKQPSQMSEEKFVASIGNEICNPIFLADKPGMGKSMIFTSLANQLRDKYKSRFVVFLNMNEFTKALEKRISTNSIPTKFDILTVIQEFVATTKFEQSLLSLWLTEPFSITKMTVELMLEGLDEVEKKCKPLALQALKCLLTEFRSVRIWVTLREHMQEEIENLSSVLSYKIRPFSENDQIAFLQKYWTNSIGRRGEAKLEISSEFVKNCIRSTSGGVEKAEIAGPPLQCRMLAEVYENILLDPVADHTSTSFKSIGLTQLYTMMLKKKLDVYLEVKEGISTPSESTKLSNWENMNLWHIYFAIKLLFNEKAAYTFRKYLNIKQKTMGIIEAVVKKQGVIESLDPVRFIHRTFAEYFVALFIFKVLTNDEDLTHLDSENETFQTFLVSEIFDVSKQQFTYNATTSVSRSGSEFKFPILAYFLNAMLNCDYDGDNDGDNDNSENGSAVPLKDTFLQKIHDFDPDVKKIESSKSVIFATVRHNCLNIAQLLLDSLSLEERHKFFNSLTIDSLEFLLEALVLYSDNNFFAYICSKIEEWHDHEQNKLFELPVTIFNLALRKGKYNIVKFLVENKGFGPATWHRLHKEDKKLRSVIHHVVEKSRHDKEEVLEEKIKLLKYLVLKDNTILELKDKKGLTPILVPISTSFELQAFLVAKLGANVNATGNYNNTIFHWVRYSIYAKAITPKQYHVMLESFLDCGFNQINLVNTSGETPLHCAVKTYNDSLLEETLQLFKKAGANFNALCKDGNTVLHFCIEKDCEPRFIEKLVDCGSNISVENSNKQSPLRLAINKGNIALVEMFKEKCNVSDKECVEE